MTTPSSSAGGFAPRGSIDGPAAQFLEGLDLLPLPFTISDLPSVRTGQFESTPTFDDLVAGRPVESRDLIVPGHHPVELSVLRPCDIGGALGCVLFAHGGGFMFGNRFFEGEALVDLVEEHQVVVVAVEYRLAPEHPYPAALDDCMASLDWVMANAAQLAVDPARVVVAGRSAGGHLAAAMSLRARDEGKHALAGQLLIYPMLDDSTIADPGDDVPDIPLWNHLSNLTAWQAYLGGRNDAEYGVPSSAAHFAGMAPAYIEVGSADLFRDECDAYAGAIWRTGGSAELHVWAGGYHGFDHIARGTVIASAALAARASWIERVLRVD